MIFSGALIVIPVLCRVFATMSYLSAQALILGMCCVFLLTNGVQCKRRSSSSSSPGYSSSSRRTDSNVINPKVAVRLVSRFEDCSGLLQVRSEDSWLYVCESTFTAENTFVACQELNCGFPYSHYGRLTEIRGDDSWNSTFNCSGQEQHLSDCPTAPSQNNTGCEPIYLLCAEYHPEHNVYIYSRGGNEHNLFWAYEGHSLAIKCTVNSPFKVRSFVFQMWTDTERSEWSQPAVDNTAYFFLPPIHLPDKTNTNFNFNCPYDFEIKPDTFSRTRPGYFSYAAPSYAQLVGHESRCLGSLELEHEGQWRAVSQQLWSLKEAAVVCRQLHCGSVISTSTQSRELQPVWRFYSDCDGSETALLGCGIVREGQSVSTVNIVCSDVLYPGNINVTSERNSSGVDPVVVYSPYSFYINCSVPPQFPGGHFSLVFTGDKHSLALNQTAVDHSAVFIFGLAEKAHSGNYSCIYHNTVTGLHFSSQSQTLAVEVEDVEDVLLNDGAESEHTLCSGTLLMTNRSQIKMVSAESVHWDMRHASIVCRQLRCGPAVSTSKTELSKVTPMWRFFSDCDGSEAALLQCGGVSEWFSSTAVNVVCADKTSLQ